jgi:hypothetical protein
MFILPMEYVSWIGSCRRLLTLNYFDFIKVNHWLTWLEQAEEEESDEDA